MNQGKRAKDQKSLKMDQKKEDGNTKREGSKKTGKKKLACSME